MQLEFILKGKLAENGLSLSKLATMLETSPQNLTQKVKRGSFTYDEVQHIADLLGYVIKWEKK